MNSARRNPPEPAEILLVEDNPCDAKRVCEDRGESACGDNPPRTGPPPSYFCRCPSLVWWGFHWAASRILIIAPGCVRVDGSRG